MVVVEDAYGDRVTVSINNISLPDDEGQREELLSKLEATVNNVFADHGIDPQGVTVYGGHVFAQIEPGCPVCGEFLHIDRLHADDENGAVGYVSCDCGWDGKAIYRVIDFHEDDASPVDADSSETVQRDLSDVLDDTDTVATDTSSNNDGIFDTNSCVAIYGLDLLYIDY